MKKLLRLFALRGEDLPIAGEAVQIGLALGGTRGQAIELASLRRIQVETMISAAGEARLEPRRHDVPGQPNLVIGPGGGACRTEAVGHFAARIKAGPSGS